jgi:hypothetical protein
MASANVALGNSGQGILVSGGSGHVITDNHVVGKLTDGIQLGSVGPGVVVHKNNLFGNGSNRCGNLVAIDAFPFATKAFFIKLPVLP